MIPRAAILAIVFACTAFAAPPNIVVILADDLAWSDLGCYGSKVCETPRLDALAAEGMRFTDAYASAPLCSPSRAALLTGKSPARLNFEFVTKWEEDRPVRAPEHTLAPPPFTLNLPLEETTLAELLGAAGYLTGMTGKWHLNTHHKTYNGWSPVFGPRQQGFQFAVETFGSHPWAYRGTEEPSFKDLPRGAYAPDDLTDAAIEFLAKSDRGRPFFLFVSHFYVHDPVRPRGGWLEKKYRAKLGPGAARERVLYGGYVETLDHHVGRLLDAIDRYDTANDTVVIFTSDNGGHPVFAANAPLRGSKWHLYEGGIRAPLIVRWPGRVEAGSASDAVVLGADIFPTAAELAGVAPGDPNELDGVSFFAALRGERTLRSTPAVWHFPYYHPGKGYSDKADTVGIGDPFIAKTRPLSAIRKGRYKLLYFHEDKSIELYDLDADIGEQNDLGGARPEVASQLKSELLEYLGRVEARWPTPIDNTD